MFVFFYIRRAANLNSVQPPLITCTQTLTHAINLLGERLALIGPKWDFSWLYATENDRLCVREVKTIWSHRSPQRCQTNRKRNNRKPVWGRISFFFCASLPSLPPSLSLSFFVSHADKKKRKEEESASLGHLSSAHAAALEVDSYHLKKHKSLTHGLFMFLCNNQY